jgi:uncharacterized protein (TIGR01777 family)
MTVAISGSSGLIGSALRRSLERDGHVVRRLARGSVDRAMLADVDAVVNLAGEPIDQRWTGNAQRKIRESRVRGTATLAHAIAGLSHKPPVLLSGSAIGIYGNRGDDLLDEQSSYGDDFLARVCVEWEQATSAAEAAGVRVVHLRTGIVLAREGGALKKLLLPFRFGVGGKLASGRQWMSWIALADIVSALRMLLVNSSVSGPVNLASPNPVRNSEMTTALSNELHRPAAFPVPRFAMKLVFGEMADVAALASQRAIPSRLLAAGFEFRYPTIEQALAAMLGS